MSIKKRIRKPLTEEQKVKKYAQVQEYIRQNIRKYTLNVRNDDIEVIERLNSVENKQQYILGLIKADIEKGKQQ